MENKQEDITMSAVDTTVQDEEDKKNAIIDVDILIMVKSAQNQNGLRHNDYARYHHYCIRKLHRMRKSLKFTNGRKQYTKKQVTSEEATKNHKFIHLLVFKCEANWAYAMQQRQLVAQGGAASKDARNPNRVKYLAKKRLQRASQAGQELLNVAKGSLDAYQQVEIEAYSSHIQAVYQLECKDYKNALDNLLKSKIIYQKISEFKDTLEEIIYKEKVSQLDTLIRQCAFSLKGSAVVDGAGGDKVIASMVTGYPVKGELEEQVVRVKSQTKREQIENIEEINYNNKIIPLKTEKLKQVFKRVESQMQDIQEYSAGNSTTQFESSHQIKNYLQLVNILEDASLVIKKEKAEESKKSEQSGQLYNILLSYVQKLKLQSALERNLL